jgi:predicted nucleic acid-binding protein
LKKHQRIGVKLKIKIPGYEKSEGVMMTKAVLLDTSFFIRLLDKNDALHKNAKDYFKYFLEKDIAMMISTISIAEYCVIGDVHELPLKNLQILPFNLDHAKRTGEFAKIVFQNKKALKLKERNIIPNDTKLFAQADTAPTIEFYLSSDTESAKILSLLKEHTNLKFQFINLKMPYSETFGMLDLGH